MKRKFPKVIMFYLFIGLIIMTGSIEAFAADEHKLISAWNEFVVEYRVIMAFVTGMGALTCILLFIYHMIQLANLSGHPIKRREALTNIMISMICTSLLGGLSVITALFYEIMLM